MREQILTHLTQIEEQYSVKILLAVESGSRAWGFPSPDSDYDVRFVYVRKKGTYLSLDDYKDTIEYLHEDVLDINGWDIKKFLQYLKKSSATSFEWLLSHIIYTQGPDFIIETWKHYKTYYSGIHKFNHYRGIELSSYKSNVLKGSIKLKKHFYVIRPLLTIKWIKERNTIPPVTKEHLLQIINDEALIFQIRDLITLKSNATESYFHPIETTMLSFIENQFDTISNFSFPKEIGIGLHQLINEFFRENIKKYE